jgi:hypothetical protein
LALVFDEEYGCVEQERYVNFVNHDSQKKQHLNS